MKVEIKGSVCTVVREPGDPRFKTESTLLHHVKKALAMQGFDLIKKRMCKDGHLVSAEQQYLRTRRRDGICVFNPRWQVEGAESRFNRDGSVDLAVEKL